MREGLHYRELRTFSKELDNINSAVDNYIQDLLKKAYFQWNHFKNGEKRVSTNLRWKVNILNLIWNNIRPN